MLTSTEYIKVKNFEKNYNNLRILKGINFSLKKDEKLAILGPSGSGKTTLLRTLIGLESYESNGLEDSILIDGKSRDKYLLSNRISYVPQKYSNFEWLTTYENIELGVAHSSNKKKLNINGIIENLGLKDFEDYYMSQLSGGMQQRVAIGRALGQDTDIIAMDEPFGALDFVIRERLQTLVKSLNKTIIFVTHDIEEALFIADRIIVLSPIPSTILVNYKLEFSNIDNKDIKYTPSFINLKKDIQESMVKSDLIIKEFRKLGTLRGGHLANVSRYPFSDIIRNQVQLKDLSKILELIEKEGNELRLGVILLRNINSKNGLIIKKLIEKFQLPKLAYLDRFFILHELAFRTDDSKIREQLYNFILADIEKYRNSELEYSNDKPENLIQGLKHRISIQNHEKKVWVYLLSIALLDKNQREKDLIESTIHNSDDFTKRVCLWILNNIYDK